MSVSLNTYICICKHQSKALDNTIAIVAYRVNSFVFKGSDAILLGAETLRGLYPVETISTVGKICAEAKKVFNQEIYFKKTVKYGVEPMTHLESIASSDVRAAPKVKASVIIVFTSSRRAARLIAKYRPTMPILSVVIPRLKTNQLRWSFTGAFEARQSLIARGLFPMLADPRHPEVLTEMKVPAIFTDFCEEAANLAARCITSATKKTPGVPVQLNPFRQPLAVEDSALYLPCYSNCFILGM